MASLMLSFPAFATTQMLMGGCTDVLTDSTRVCPVDVYHYDLATEANVRTLVGVAGALSAMRFTLTTAPGAGESRTPTVRVNAASSILACTISGTATTCTDSDSVSVSAGDELTLQITRGSAGTVNSDNGWLTLTFTPTTANEVQVGGGTADGVISATVTNYVPLLGVGFTDTDEEATVTRVLTPGTFQNFYADLSGSPDNGVGTQSYTFTVRKNKADTTITCAVSETATTCNDTANSFSVVAGDVISVSSVPANTPTVRVIAFGARFLPAAQEEGIFGVHRMDAPASTSVANFSMAAMSIGDWDSSETGSRSRSMTQAFTITSFGARMVTAPDNGAGVQSYAFVVRDDGASTNQTCTISEAETTCNFTTGRTRIADQSLIGVMATPSGTPTASRTITSILGTLGPRRVFTSQ